MADAKKVVSDFIAAQAGKSSSSKKHARIVASGFIKHARQADPKEWTKNQVFGYLSKIEPNHTRNTLYIYSVQLRALLRYHGREDLASLMKPPKRAQALKVVPSEEEVTRMKAMAKNERDRLIVQILSRTGLRVGELCHLEVEDIDLENRQIQIRAKGMWAPKGLKEGLIPFDSETGRQIKEYLGERTNGLLIDLSESYIRNIVKSLAMKAKVKDAKKVTPHSLRHHFAVYFLQHGGDIRSLQKILRHSDLATTAIYLDYTEDAVAQAYDKVFEPPQEAET